MNLKHVKSQGVRILSLFLMVVVVAGYNVLTFASDSASGTSAVSQDTVWTYLDTGEDPAGNSSDSGYDRTSWTKAGYSTTGW